MDPNQFLPLDGDRTVAFTAGGFPYRFVLSRITAEDWDRFFDGIVVSSQSLGNMQKNIIDMNSAGDDLVERKLTAARGYKGDFASRTGWQKRIPAGHSKLIAQLLRDVEISKKASDGPIDPDCYEVELTAKWNANEEGLMVQYDSLVHRFNPPTAEHKRKYNRSMAESRVYGGGRTGTTVYVPRQKVMVEFYNDLIASVNGYSVNGAEITSAEDAKRHMDAYHKVIAVQVLFAEPEIEPAAEAEAA